VPKKEAVWLFKKDFPEARARCLKRFVRSVKKNVKSLSSPEETGRFIAKIAIPNARIAAVKEV
jgi:hypothetical protein